MNLTERLLTVALYGAEWVLWLLIILSVVSVAITVERILFFRGTRLDFDSLQQDLRRLLKGKDFDKARKLVADRPSLETLVLSAGLGKVAEGVDAVGEAMVGAKAKLKLRLSRNLAVLGTLGNNAPFIGLFGTVIGVIKAFHDLSAKKGQGPEVVMGSLSEALIATAVGLLVAIPAVIAYNYFQGVVRERLAQTDALAHIVLSEMKGEEPAAGKGK